MLGLVEMATRLAEARNHDDGRAVRNKANGISFVLRSQAERTPDLYPVSAEYYRIIDRISRGEKP